ncbi:hypothetical protein MMC10_007519 [Thelotrema lepadinum]|nr:hypothetical protein [Thelotrema lepadinum]
MNANTLHTPLEALLFFQSLRIHGIDNASFGRISSSLKENKFIQQHNTYDENRLSPDALRGLYLQLLKDELRAERSSRASPVKDGEQPSKKRKLSTPPLQTIEEAADHKYLIPRLVNRLYARYRDHTVQAIHEEETRYKELANEIADIDLGKWDARLEAEEESRRKASRNRTSISTLLSDENQTEVNGSKAHGAQEHGQTQEAEESPAPLPNGHAPRPGSPVAPTVAPELASSNMQASEEKSSSRAQSPSKAQISSILRHEDPQSHSRSSSQSRVQPITMAPPRTGASPVEYGQRPITGASLASAPAVGSPRPGQTAIAHGERTSGSPIILPPPAGMLRPSASPTAPSPGLPTPSHGQVPPLPPPPVIAQPRTGFAQRPYPYYDQNAYPPSYSQYSAPLIPPYPLPTQGQMAPYATPPPVGYRPPIPPGGTPQYHHTGYFGAFQSAPPAQYTQRTPLPPQVRPGQVPNATAPTTPITSLNDKRRLQGLPPIDTSVSSTKWKTSARNVPKEAQKSPVPPDLSPDLPSSASPSPEPEPLRLDGRKPHAVSSKDTPSRTDTPTRGRGRGRWGGRGSRGRGGRGGAVSSPALATPKDVETRSQSVASNAEDTPTDTNPLRRVKAEPPSTPAQATDDRGSLGPTPIADTFRSGRRKDVSHSGETPRTGQKRKRGNTIEGTPDIPGVHPPTRPNQVLASRNFPRVVSALLHDIQSHKLASLFARPITERDAPGYRSLVYQPQDIKSIRGAISAGSRYLASLSDSMTEDVGSPAATPAASSKTGSIWVERSADVVPPKAIVNSAQLEKELCRMFANAVMFNPDPKRGFGPTFKLTSTGGDEDEDDDEMEVDEESNDDGGGFVRDAREMFGDVERSVAAWRAAERVNDDAGRKSVERRETSVDESMVTAEEGGAEEGLRRSRRG